MTLLPYPILRTLPLSGRQGALGWRSRELMLACPLEGLVRSVAPQQKTSENLRIFCSTYANFGLTN
jgi:hypothetical protein